MKRISIPFLFSGLLIGFLGSMLYINNEYFTFGTQVSDPQVYTSLLALMGLVFLTGLSLVIISFRNPNIRSYPAWCLLGAYIFCVLAGYIGLVLLPAVKGNTQALNIRIIIMIVLMLAGIICFYVASSSLPKELRRAKKVKKSDFDIEETVEMMDKFMKD